MNKNIVRLALSVMLLTSFLNIQAQENEMLTIIRNKMKNIYDRYNNLPNLTFDVTYDYGIDSPGVRIPIQTIKGTYTMNVNKAKYAMGDIEYLQNNDYFIALHHKQKAIIVSSVKTSSASQNLPMKDMLDSLMIKYGDHYTYSSQNEDSTHTEIKFIRADSTTQYDSIIINYNPITQYLNWVQYNYTLIELATPPSQSGIDITESSAYVTRHKYLIVNFSNYRHETLDNSIYETNTYIWNDGGTLKPSDKYNYYKVFDTRILR